MDKLRIHRFENPQWGRGHLPWYKKFDKYLEKFFQVEVINYTEKQKTFKGLIELSFNSHKLGKTIPLTDRDCIIENLDKKKFVVLGTNKYVAKLLNYTQSNDCNSVLSAHFSYRFNLEAALKLKGYDLSNLTKIKPWFFPFFNEFDTDFLREKRNKKTEFIDNLFFKGGGIGPGNKSLLKNIKNSPHTPPYRKLVYELEKRGIVDTRRVNYQKYLDTLISHKLGLSYYIDLDYIMNSWKHPGEMCYRDMEMIAVGLPYIRIEYKSNLYNGLYPDYHYISISREDAYQKYYSEGIKGLADLFENKYKEVINNKEVLNFISKNQIEWFDKYVKNEVGFKTTVNLLDLNKWIK